MSVVAGYLVKWNETRCHIEAVGFQHIKTYRDLVFFSDMLFVGIVNV